MVIDEGEDLSVSADRRCRSKKMHSPMRVAEGVTSDVDILVVKLAGGACNTLAIELIHEVNIGTGEVGVTGE